MSSDRDTRWTGAERFRRALAAAPGVRVVVDNTDAAVYTLDWPSGAVANRSCRPATGVEVRRTPWTPVGVAFLVMLLVRVWARARRGEPALRLTSSRRLRPLTLPRCHFWSGLCSSIAERFVLLTS